MLEQILGGGGRSRRRVSPSQRRRRSGFGFYGPLPGWSGRTRRGSRVHVRGCCLPIPLFLATGTVLGARRLLQRR